jgi:hypothetical protein
MSTANAPKLADTAGAGIDDDPAVGLAKMPPQATAVALEKAFDYNASLGRADAIRCDGAFEDGSRCAAQASHRQSN